ncbi:hypothetical protein J1N35_037089 [Gossypium stocksii]|uniref:Reverse transcriptase zinc-binding domain-containing protein n=1 Tax=Gossypium stocksii TaxID=47602 RepID=A0A9D3UJX2_9ROSI|nr:hypothetical protein J1N35_037089 [Gossypium stocksii]
MTPLKAPRSNGFHALFFKVSGMLWELLSVIMDGISGFLCKFFGRGESRGAGMGPGPLKRFNLALDDNALWVRILCSKYGMNERLPESILRSSSLSLWRALSKVWSLLKDNLVWSMGDRRSICCWKDHWIMSVGPLMWVIPSHANLDPDYMLDVMVTVDGV